MLSSHTRDRSGAAESHERGARVAKILVTLGASLALVLHLASPALRLDTVAIILLGIAVIPWLDVVFESIDTPFGGVKYRTLTQRIDQLTGESAALRKVQEANEARERIEHAGADADPSDRLNALAAEYSKLRDVQEGMPSGAERTRAMTTIMGQMISAADSGASIPLEAALQGGDLGRRLAAYAVLYARPDAAYAIPLVNSVIEVEPKPFGQFWGLRAIARLIEVAAPEAIDLNTARRLKEFRRHLPPASDRMFELRRILEQLGLT